MIGGYAVLGIPPSVEEMEDAEKVIGGDVLEAIEKSLGLNSPHKRFRQSILERVVEYLKESKTHKDKPKKLARKQLKKLKVCAIEIADLVNNEDTAMREAIFQIIGEANLAFEFNRESLRQHPLGRPLAGLNLFNLGKFFSDFASATEKCFEDKPRSYSSNRLAENLAIQLMYVFQKFKREAPCISTNSLKTKYSGPFFCMADTMLTRLGHTQQNVTRGQWLSGLINRVFPPNKARRKK